MATDTVSAAAPEPSDPPGQTNASNQPAMGFLASMLAPVEPARPTFDLSPTTDSSTTAASPDGALDRSAPGISSASFRDAEQSAAKDAAGENRKAQGSIWKALWLAGAQRWAKGGGAANKRFDVQKAKAQAHQVKEVRTTTVMNSSSPAGRNSVGSGGASKGNPGKAGGDSRGKGVSNSPRNGSSGSGQGGSGGGRGASGNSGGTGSGAGTGRGKKPDNRRENPGPTKAPGGKGAGASGNGDTRTSGKSGADKRHGDGKGSSPKGPGSNGPAGATGPGHKRATSGAGGKSGAAGKDGKPGKSGTTGAGGNGHKSDTRTPLEKSRETGHKDGSAVRNVIDHVKAYKDGTVDGYRDKSHENAKEHDRLDKAHADHKKKTGQVDPSKGVTPTEQEDDGVSTDVKPLTIKHIDANTLTLGTEGAQATVSRRELRNFKQYERKLEVKETVLQKIAEACKQLEKQAEGEAKDCQHLAEQAKGVEGGEKLLAKLNRLADVAKSQAAEAAALTKRAKRAAEMCKVVLTNIQTRYSPLYKAVVDSDETKPAELRFYNDKGSYAPAA